MHYLLSEEELRAFSGIQMMTRKQISSFRTLRNMYSGDHWDRGYGYIGPLPIEEDPNQGQIMQTLKRQFTPRNVVKEIVDRAVDALIGRSPDYQIYDRSKVVPKSVQEAERRRVLRERLEKANASVKQLINEDPEDPNEAPEGKEPDPEASEEDKKIAEAEILLSNLWTQADIPKILRQAMVEYMLTGEVKVRLYINKNYTRLEAIDDEDLRMLEAVKYVKAEVLDSSAAKIIDDEGELLSIVKLSKDKYQDGQNKVEISFVGSDNKTYIAVFNNSVPQQNATKTDINLSGDLEGSEHDGVVVEELMVLKGKADVSEGFSLDGNIIVIEITGEPYVTEPMLQQNRALNLDLSLGVGVLVESGFAEMVTTNVEMEEQELSDGDGGTISAPKKLFRGPTTTNNLVGIQTVDAEGTVKFQTPGVTFKSPTPVTTFKEGHDLYYSQILHEAKQAFILAVGDATVTGESRIQQRQDFVKKVQPYKPDVDKFGSKFLATFLHLCASIAGRDGYFSNYSVAYDTKISAGELSGEEKQLILNQYQDGLISRESALVLLGSEDPILELELIRVDEAEKLELQVRRLVTASKYSEMVNPDTGAKNSATGGSTKLKDESTSNRDKNDQNKSGGLQ